MAQVNTEHNTISTLLTTHLKVTAAIKILHKITSTSQIYHHHDDNTTTTSHTKLKTYKTQMRMCLQYICYNFIKDSDIKINKHNLF